MKSISRKLKAEILPAALIIKGFVKGDEETCNYELYLTELINNCPNFMKSFQYPFVYQYDQAHGEADAVSGTYGLDYKLIASQSALHANSVFSHRIWKEMKGVTAYGSAKNQTGTIKVTRIFAALRDFEVEDLKRISDEDTTDHVLVDVKSFLKLLGTMKNLLLFFPYEFWMTTPSNDEDGIDETINAIERDFTNAMVLREEWQPNFDTYFATIYKTKFLLLSFKHSFNLLDYIDTSTSATFNKLNDYGI